MLVTVDTNILIWGVRHDSTPGQEFMIDRAVAFLAWLDANDHKLVLTATSIAEYFIGAPPDAVAKEMKSIASRFKIIPFDTRAALVAAELRSDKSFISSLRDTVGKSAPAIKCDVVLVATAKAHGVQKIYSNDDDIRALSLRCGLPYSPLPEPADLAQLTSPPVDRPAEVRSLFDDMAG